MTTMAVWPQIGTTVTLASGYVVTASGAVADLTDEVESLIRRAKLLTWDPTALNPNPSPIPPISVVGSGLVFETVAQMLAYPALINNQPAKLLGYRTANDGGGGDFWFAFGSTDTIDSGLVFGTALGNGRWKRTTGDRPYFRNVKWFGAYGDGVHDDTAAIKAAIASLSVFAWGAEIFSPSGDYLISDTIKLEFGSSYSTWSNVTVSGENATTAAFRGATWMWAGPTNNPYGFSTAANPAVDRPLVTDSVMFQIGAPGALVKHMGFAVAAGHQCGTQVNIGHDQGVSPAFAVSNVKFEWCAFKGGPDLANGTCLQHVVFDLWENPNDQNLEDCGFENCAFGGSQHAAIWYRQTTQPFSNFIHKCTMLNAGMMQGKTLKPGYTYTGQEAYGIGLRNDSIAMSMTMQDTEFQRYACMCYFRAMPAAFEFLNGAAEAYKKILYQVWSNANDLGVISISAGRWSPDGAFLPSYGGLGYTSWDNPSGDWDAGATSKIIQLAGDTTLNLRANGFRGGYAEEATYIEVDSNDIRSSGNQYGNLTPFKRRVVWSDSQGRTYSDGDVGYSNALGRTTKIPTQYGCENPGGVVTISGAATSATVTFAVPECTVRAGGGAAIVPDYKVLLTVQSVTGAPTVTAPYVSARSATGFTISLPTAPGIGNSITIAYEPRRV